MALGMIEKQRVSIASVLADVCFSFVHVVMMSHHCCCLKEGDVLEILPYKSEC